MSNSGGGLDPGATVAIIFVGVVLFFAAVCALSSCNGGDGSGGAQLQNEGRKDDKDGNMVVLDGIQVAQAVVEVQPGCCCGGGGDGGDGGGCGGCGGD